MARLTTRFWVDAYLARLRLRDIPAFVTAHGDDHAGAVLVKLATLDGRAQAFTRGFDLASGAPRWQGLCEGAEAEVDAAIARQRGFDPDLWVLEVEDRAGRHLLDEDGLRPDPPQPDRDPRRRPQAGAETACAPRGAHPASLANSRRCPQSGAMDWRDTGILLSTRRHGETGLILDVFTPSRGRHLGVLRGGTSRRMAPHLQPGTQLDIQWRARLEQHLGQFAAEPERSRAAAAMADRLALAGLGAVTALLSFCLPERAPHPALYARSERLLDLLDRPDLWPLAYLRWEMALLEDMGFGLDLSACTVSGATAGLAYISPRTGRAVTAQAAGDWTARLLPLPPVMRGEGEAQDTEIVIALGTTGHFLHNHVAPALGDSPVPAARGLFLDRLTRRARLE